MRVDSPRSTRLVGSLALLLIPALAWWLALGPKTAALSEVRDQIVDTRSRNDVLELQLVTLQRQAEDLAGTQASAAALERIFPPTADQPGLFKQVTDAAVRAGVRPGDVTALTPTAPTLGAADPAAGVQPTQPADAGLARQTVTLSIDGTYDETRLLLENLEDMPRAYLLGTLTVSAGSTGGTYTTTVTGDMFLMPPVDPPERVPATSAPMS